MHVRGDAELVLLLPMLFYMTPGVTTCARTCAIEQDCIRTARTNGLSSRTLFFCHGLRNAMLRLVTILALSFGGIVGSAVITKQVFAIAGMGSFFFTALNLLDYPVLLAYLVLG